MQIQAAFPILVCLSAAISTGNAGKFDNAQHSDSSIPSITELQVGQGSYPYPGTDYFESSNPVRPAPFGFQSEWISDSNTGLVTAQIDATLPLLMFKAPPPLVKIGFAYTNLFAADISDIPNDLYEYSIGLSWVRPLNDRWTIRTILGVGFATDNLNTSSDAWQFRGGAFAIYKQNEQIKWTLGALATGRDDLPVIPAIGAVWQPNLYTRIDLLFPQPKVNRLIFDDGTRQQWAYVGFGINGSTWAYEQIGITDDRLTYKDLRLVAGWESRPSASGGLPFSLGKTLRVELGYVFSREFEFENETRLEDLDDGFVLGISTKF